MNRWNKIKNFQTFVNNEARRRVEMKCHKHFVCIMLSVRVCLAGWLAFVCENDLFVCLSVAQNQNVSYVCRQQFHFKTTTILRREWKRKHTFAIWIGECIAYVWFLIEWIKMTKTNKPKSERDMMKNRLNPMIIIVNKSVVVPKRTKRRSERARAGEAIILACHKIPTRFPIWPNYGTFWLSTLIFIWHLDAKY